MVQKMFTYDQYLIPFFPLIAKRLNLVNLYLHMLLRKAKNLLKEINFYLLHWDLK